MSVKAIDRQTVHQICSGQVVLSLAVAVKELVENSLDAGATSIGMDEQLPSLSELAKTPARDFHDVSTLSSNMHTHTHTMLASQTQEIRLKEHGSELVEVADNGSGVEPENFEALTLKHHTSKLQAFSDLVSVTTFGFRGEALSSLCALSNLVVTTCHASQPAGTRIEYDSNGGIKAKTTCAREVGTTVMLHHLFHTLPVRHKEFQRNLKKEYARMVQMLQGYCLICTGVRITCHDQSGKGKKQLVVSTGGNPSVRENIISVFGKKQTQQLVEISQVSVEDIQLQGEEAIAPEMIGLFRLSGYVSRCNHGYGRSATDRQFFFFNSRPCDHQKLTKTVNEVYHMYNRHQYPFIVLNISTAREHVDVNLTPDKRQVMLHQEKALLLLVKASLMKLYGPMQSQYDTQQGSSPLSSQEIASPGDGFTPPKLTTLKRNFAYFGEPQPDKSQPKPKQPKLYDYGITQSSSSSSRISALTSVTSVTSVLTVTSASSSSHTCTSVPSSVECFAGDSIQGDTVTIAAVSSQFPDITVSSAAPAEPASTVRTEVENCSHFEDWQGSQSTGAKHECQLQSLARKSSESTFQNPNSDSKEGSELAVGCEDEIVLNVSSVRKDVFSLDSEVGSQLPGVESNSTRESSVGKLEDKRHVMCGCHGSATDVTLTGFQMDSVQHYRDRVGLTRNVIFDLGVVASRLEALRHGGGRTEAGTCRGFRAQIRPDSSAAAEEELRREIRKEMFPKMEVIGQFNLGFIIVKLDSDLFIVDQHATDEKYNFERLQRETVLQHQKLLQPLALELTAVGESVVMENLEIFQMNGFQFQIDMEASPMQRVKLTAHPVSKNWALGPSDINELIFLLSDSPGEVVRPSAVRRMFASRACRTSVMIGTPLSKPEMVKLLAHMAEIDQPWVSSHGQGWKEERGRCCEEKGVETDKHLTI